MSEWKKVYEHGVWAKDNHVIYLEQRGVHKGEYALTGDTTRRLPRYSYHPTLEAAKAAADRSA